MPPRTLVIALDAADPSLVRELARTGAMPTFARLLREGAQLPTLAPEGVFVSANWPTIFTALRPDRHRYLCWEEIGPSDYAYRQTTPHEVRGTPFWEVLSAAGRSVAIFDVPHSVVRPVNGVMVAEWGCHDRHFGPASWPPELALELRERNGGHTGSMAQLDNPQFAPCDYAHRAGDQRTDEETERLFATLCEDVERKQAASLALLDRGHWDLFLSVLGEFHCIGHQLWHLHDREHPRYDPALAARLEGDPLVAVLRRLDAAVALHLDRLEPDDTAYVLLSHGMTAHYDATHLLDTILHRLDWSVEHHAELGVGTRLAAGAARAIPHPARSRALRSLTPLLRRAASPEATDPLPPLPERRWFAALNNTVEGAVRLNLWGREPEGRIAAEDRSAVLRWLVARLGELVNVETGGRVVRRCTVSDDVYRRSDDDAMPDLFIEWERTAPIEHVWSPSTGTVRIPYGHWRQGDHAREGLLLAVGPGIEPGARREVARSDDLGATFSAAAGVVLEGVDGRPVNSVLPAARRAAVAAGGARTRRRPRAPRWATGPDAGTRKLAGDVRAAQRRLDELHEELAGERAQAARLHGTTIAAQAEAREALAHAKAQGGDLADLVRRVSELDRTASVWAGRAWFERVATTEGELISVITPTRDRRRLLEEAIASVEAQSYPRWELIVVDDGSTDGTGEYLAALGDPRIRCLHTEGVGACAARNVGLDEATGSIIAYLDDDNVFDRHWLKALAHTFTARSDASVVFGARIIDDRARLLAGAGAEHGDQPWLHAWAWDEHALQAGNQVDMSCIAHRRTDIRFDTELAYYGDWDLLLRLTAERPAVAVPTVAVLYRTDHPERLSTTTSEHQMRREHARVMSRRRVAQPEGPLPGAEEVHRGGDAARDDLGGQLRDAEQLDAEA